MLIYKMIILSSTTTIMTMSINATSLSLTTPTPTPISSSYYKSMIKRLLIVFGSISFLWFIMVLIFVSLQTFRYLKKKTSLKLFRYHRPIAPPLPPLAQSTKEDEEEEEEENVFDADEEDDEDDRTSVYTSVSFLSEQSTLTTHGHSYFVAACERIPEEEFELTLPIGAGFSNMGFSQSTLASSNGGGSSLYYPACRNFAYSQSTLASSTADLHIQNPSSSISSITNDSKRTLGRQIKLKRRTSQSSTTTVLSQITNATNLSSGNTSTSSSRTQMTNVPIITTTTTTTRLPTLMITDCDRLQTDIIELEDFEPEKDWRRARPELRSLLNERMPQAVR